MKASEAKIIRSVLGRIEETFGCFPENYLVVDLETTGVNVTEDLPLQFGYCLVEKGKVVECKANDINWLDQCGINSAWVISRMDKARKSMTEKGKSYRMSVQRLQERGKPPIPSLVLLYELIRRIHDANGFILAHNGVNFDTPLISTVLREFLGVEFDFGENLVVDTGIIEKAIQLDETPLPNESLAVFSRRVGAIRAKGVYWALDGHCLPKYGLEKKMPVGAEMHDAGHDAYAVHLLFETYRNLLKDFDEKGEDLEGQDDQGAGDSCEPGELTGFDPFSVDEWDQTQIDFGD